MTNIMLSAAILLFSLNGIIDDVIKFLQLLITLVTIGHSLCEFR